MKFFVAYRDNENNDWSFVNHEFSSEDAAQAHVELLLDMHCRYPYFEAEVQCRQ